jgi:hypothetical protein
MPILITLLIVSITITLIVGHLIHFGNDIDKD